MIFTAKTLSTLEYDKIIEMLVECTATEGAKARARALMPTDEYDFVVDRQNKTDDAKRLINAKGYPSFSAPESVPEAADRAYKGGILSPRELIIQSFKELIVRTIINFAKLYYYTGFDVKFTGFIFCICGSADITAAALKLCTQLFL